MDQMRISGTEPSLVIHSQTKKFKIDKWYQNVPKQGNTKRDGVINPIFRISMNF